MMRSARLRYIPALAMLLLVLACGLAPAQDDVLVLDEDKPAPPATGKQPEISLPPETEVPREDLTYRAFYSKWRAYLQSQEDPDATKRVEKEILDLKKTLGLARVPGLALSSVQLGKTRLDSNNIDAALAALRFAAELDPSLPEAYYAQAVTHMHRGIKGIGAAIAAGIRGFFAPRDHLRGAVYFRSKMTVLVLAAFALVAATVALVLFLKYNHLLRHDAEEKLSGKYPVALVHLGVFVLAVLPALVGVGPLWLAPFWLMLFCVYAKLSEKIAAVVLAAIFVPAYPLYQLIVQDASSFLNPEASVFATAFLEGPSPRAVMILEQHLRDDPSDYDAIILLASLHNSNGETDRAIELLQGLMQKAESDPRPPNNLASIYFSRGELDYALRLAQRALDHDGRSAIYKFNISNIYRAKFNFTDANRYMDEARKADPELIHGLEGTSSERVVESLPSVAILERKLSKDRRSFLSLLPNPFSILAVLLLGGTVYRAFFLKKPGIARECLKCGKPFCKKCQPNVKVPGFCIQCLHIFVRKDGVSPASRKEKMVEIESYSRRQRRVVRISSFILPGAGRLFQDRIASGLAVLVPWFFLVSLLGFTYRYAGIFFFEPEDGFRIVSLICVLLMIVLYLVTNLVLGRRDKSS